MLLNYAFVAQQVERTTVNRDVGGSSPLPGVLTRVDIGEANLVGN